MRDKYWIKPGVEVSHRDFPGMKMIVDRVLKNSREVNEGDKKVMRTFVVGVECHWMDRDMRYSSGKFLTMELLPWKQSDK